MDLAASIMPKAAGKKKERKPGLVEHWVTDEVGSMAVKKAFAKASERRLLAKMTRKKQLFKTLITTKVGDLSNLKPELANALELWNKRGREKENVRREAVLKLKTAFPEEYKAAMADSREDLLFPAQPVCSAEIATKEELQRDKKRPGRLKNPPPENSTVKLDPQAPSSSFFPAAGEGMKEKRNANHNP